MTRGRQAGIVLVVGLMVMSAIAASTKVQPQPSAYGREAPSIFDGILGNVAGSPEMSTAEFQAALTESSAIILDARPYEEYAVSHIPGARAVPGKPGTTPALYVADTAEIAKTIPDKSQPLILYCNGLFCGRSERFADDLTKLGYRNGRRYQLGAPGWRALGRELYGTEPESPGAYGTDWAERSGQERLLEAAGRHFVAPVACGDRQPGDLLLFRWQAGMSAKHAGILSRTRHFIHAYEQTGVIESALVPGWEKRIAGVFRFPETG